LAATVPRSAAARTAHPGEATEAFQSERARAPRRTRSEHAHEATTRPPSIAAKTRAALFHQGGPVSLKGFASLTESCGSYPPGDVSMNSLSSRILSESI
jgi:hypothetical protein